MGLNANHVPKRSTQQHPLSDGSNLNACSGITWDLDRYKDLRELSDRKSDTLELSGGKLEISISRRILQGLFRCLTQPLIRLGPVSGSAAGPLTAGCSPRKVTSVVGPARSLPRWEDPPDVWNRYSIFVRWV